MDGFVRITGSIPSALALMFAKPTLRSLAQYGTRPQRNRSRLLADLLLTPGVGARTVRALAMIAEVVHGAPYRFTDPARFSFAHGGKDRHPFPVPIKVYDETIRVLKSAVSKARLGREEELGALKRLDEQGRLLEHLVSGPQVEELISQERERSHLYGGRSVFGWAQPPAAQPNSTPARPQRPEGFLVSSGGS